MNLPRINLIILLAILLIFSEGFSQDKKVLSGQIITEEPLNSAMHIINISRKKGGVSELSDRFSVKINIEDTLVFSSVQYKEE